MADDTGGCVGCLAILVPLVLFFTGLGLVIDGFGEEGHYAQGDYVVSEEARRGYEAAGDALGQPVQPDDPIYTREHKYVSGSSANAGKIFLGFLLMACTVGGGIYIFKKY